jgi:hypothetical protein
MNKKKARSRVISEFARNSSGHIRSAIGFERLEQNATEAILNNREVLDTLFGNEAVKEHDRRVRNFHIAGTDNGELDLFEKIVGKNEEYTSGK